MSRNWWSNLQQWAKGIWWDINHWPLLPTASTTKGSTSAMLLKRTEPGKAMAYQPRFDIYTQAPDTEVRRLLFSTDQPITDDWPLLSRYVTRFAHKGCDLLIIDREANVELLFEDPLGN